MTASRLSRLLAIGALGALLAACGESVPTLSASPNRKDGTAVFLLLDVSGSMNGTAQNAQGRSEAKLAIAKRAAIDVCKAVAKYADEKPDRTIHIGIASFSDDYVIDYPIAKPDVRQLEQAINRLGTRGGTAIGNAVVEAQKALDLSGLRSQHILIVTDGENNAGTSPDAAATALKNLPPELRPNVYLVAYDIKASIFDGVKAKDWQVFSAADGSALKSQLDEVVGGKILLER